MLPQIHWSALIPGGLTAPVRERDAVEDGNVTPAELDILAGKHIFIGRGVSHATANIGEAELELIEVELPRNKFDLRRVQDSYGRTSQPYESTGVASKTLPDLVQYDGIPGAKYRPTDITGHYRFSIGKAARHTIMAPVTLTAKLMCQISSVRVSGSSIAISPAAYTTMSSRSPQAAIAAAISPDLVTSPCTAVPPEADAA